MNENLSPIQVTSNLTVLSVHVKTNNNLTVKRMKRNIESSTITLDKISLVTLSFQGAPLWLFGFKPLKVDKVYVPDCSSFTDLLLLVQHNHLSVEPFNKQVATVGMRAFVFGSHPQDTSLHLLSGSIPF